MLTEQGVDHRYLKKVQTKPGSANPLRDEKTLPLQPPGFVYNAARDEFLLGIFFILDTRRPTADRHTGYI